MWELTCPLGDAGTNLRASDIDMILQNCTFIIAADVVYDDVATDFLFDVFRYLSTIDVKRTVWISTERRYVAMINANF